MGEVIKVENYIYASYLESLRMKYEPKPKVKKPKQLKRSERRRLAKVASLLPIGGLLTANNIANATEVDGMIQVSAPAGMIPVNGVGDAIMDKLATAFDPLIEIMVGLALPIAGVMLTGGALMIMVGMKEPGFRLIMNSALGYCLVMLSPLFIDLLAEVGKALI